MSKNFCVLPFYGTEYISDTKETACCLLPKGYDIDKLRSDMLQDIRSEYCHACWKLEDAGMTSDRKLKNSALDFYLDKDIEFIEQNARDGIYEPILIKIVTSNKCNATCVTCGPSASTSWRSLIMKHDQSKQYPEYSVLKRSIDNLNFNKLVGVNLIGGEPLYEKTNFELLQQLLDHGNSKCFISITTNGSVSLSEKNKKLLSQFKNINIGISIDGIGPVFEYMRFPLKWKKLLDNLEFFRTITDNISANQCTSNVNLLYYHETINWFREHSLNFHHNPVIYPNYFRPSALPNSVKKYILKKYNSNELNCFIGEEHTEEDDANFEKMLEVIKYQDSIKKISIKDYLPEFCDLIGYK
jgi:sulfatase maturation enzyme AslB (radical SAM superfamily)